MLIIEIVHLLFWRQKRISNGSKMASGYKNWAYGYCSETEYPGITQGVVGGRKRLYRVSGYQIRRLVRGLREAFERLVRGLWEACERLVRGLWSQKLSNISERGYKRLLFQHWQVQDLTIPIIRYEIIPTRLLRGTRGKIAGTWELTKISQLSSAISQFYWNPWLFISRFNG